MRVFPIARCEKAFILQGIIEDLRVDSRRCRDYRSLKITLGKQRGTCFVELGDTKAFASISAEIVTPKQGRPYSGLLHINLDMSPMAAPNFESGRLGDRGIEISRLIERVLKESNCLDLESLCIIAHEKVWKIIANVHIIDHDGSLVDCASTAVICALKSFRRPDVTISGENFIVHNPEEKAPVPLSLYHLPVCITFGLTEDGKCITVDPTEREQAALEGEVVIAMNSHKEVCTIHCSGGSLIKRAQILRCVSMAGQRSKEIAELIKSVFEADTVDRSKKQKKGFCTLIRPLKEMTVTFRACDIVAEILQPTSSINDDVEPSIPSFVSTKAKGRSYLISSSKTSQKLMTQPEEEAENENNEMEDDSMIIDEILNLKLSKKEDGIKTENAVLSETKNIDDDLEITAVKTNKKVRRQRMKKKDDDVAQLLMDIEADTPIVQSGIVNNVDDELEIVGEFISTKKGKKIR